MGKFSPLNLSLAGPVAFPRPENITGVDVGILATKSKHVYGLQCASVYAESEKSSAGFQISAINKSQNFLGVQCGLWNITEKFYGIQVSGIGNKGSGGFWGLQFSGIISTNYGGFKGLQYGTFVRSYADFYGIQLSCFGNPLMAKKSLKAYKEFLEAQKKAEEYERKLKKQKFHLKQIDELSKEAEEVSESIEEAEKAIAELNKAAELESIKCGDFHGLQFSCLANAAGNFTGSQISLLCASRNFNGLQLGIFANWSYDINGFQLSIFYNKSQAVHGIQISCVNEFSKKVKGIQIGLVGNIGTGSVHGFQLGCLNEFGKDGRGVQIGVLGNMGEGNFYGLQCGGINIVNGHVSGVQIGAINFCQTLRGIQIGGLNIIMHNSSLRIPVMIGMNVSW